MLISFYRICFSLTDLHHESKLLGKTTIKKHDRFFTVEADGLCSSSVSTGDVVVMSSFTAKVTRTAECRHGVLFVEIDRPADIEWQKWHNMPHQTSRETAGEEAHHACSRFESSRADTAQV